MTAIQLRPPRLPTGLAFPSESLMDSIESFQQAQPFMPEPAIAFDFGENWSEFSRHALTPARVDAARRELAELLNGVPLKGRSFLDIGFGQGLTLLTATDSNARTVGCDINSKCADVLRRNLPFFPRLKAAPPVAVGSILDAEVVERLRELSPDKTGYDIVHSWGVLHHTGNMARAIAHAASLVQPNGHFILAIYNRHWSSLPWLAIKWTYVHTPRWTQRLLIRLLSPVIYAAKWLVTRQDPNRQQRGMDFHYNVIDWVGGYPYEYASIKELTQMVAAHGFRLLKAVPAEVPTGCNEFVFVKVA